MNLSYLVTPLMAWVFAGFTKFCINSLKRRCLAFDQIGYGGMPSTHSAIVCSTACLIALKHGVGTSAFGVAFTIAIVVMLDANSLRRQIGRHAVEINKISKNLNFSPTQLRERMGHTRTEIAGGVLVGILSALFVDGVLPFVG
jgi:acid phosphatase family membrane protein YuiD